MSEKLKPCKACGGKAQFVDEFVKGEFYFYCLFCGRHGEVYATKAEAIAAWNQRASDGLISKLVGALEKIKKSPWASTTIATEALAAYKRERGG